jgi:hypothetical protein
MTDEAIDHDHVMQTGEGVAEIFRELLKRVIERIDESQDSEPPAAAGGG